MYLLSIEDIKKDGVFWTLWTIMIIGLLMAMFLLSSPEQAEAGMIEMERIAMIESSGNPLAHNKKEDGRGLFQINPVCLKEWNNFHPSEIYSAEDLWNPQVNRRIAEWYMNTRIPQMIKHFQKIDSIENRIIAWNAGIKYVKTGAEIPAGTRRYLEKYRGEI